MGKVQAIAVTMIRRALQTTIAMSRTVWTEIYLTTNSNRKWLCNPQDNSEIKLFSLMKVLTMK